MTRRILFVDDEPMVLRGLQRSLFPMRSEWDMVFVESGAQALQALDEAPFDVVVSDMRMPTMNGAELLNAVMVRHPGIARIVLSGHADKELILQCVGSAQQFLAKPCEPDVLKGAIQRAFSRRQGHELDRLREVLARVPDLPVLPGKFQELQKVLEHEESPLAALTVVIQGDIGLTAKLLKLSNSAFFGLRRTVTTVSEAVYFLGVETIKALMLLDGFMDKAPRHLPPALAPEALAEASQEVARLARFIAHEESPETADFAFAAGLLHKTGLLVLGAAQPERMQAILNQIGRSKRPLWEWEREAFGVDHAQVGAYLLELWGLPVPLAEAVRSYPCPSQTPPVFGAATAVHGACVLLAGRPGYDDPLWRMEWDAAHMEALELRAPWSGWAGAYLTAEPS